MASGSPAGIARPASRGARCRLAEDAVWPAPARTETACCGWVPASRSAAQRTTASDAQANAPGEARPTSTAAHAAAIAPRIVLRKVPRSLRRDPCLSSKRRAALLLEDELARVVRH